MGSPVLQDAVLGLGNPLLDMSAEVDAAYLARFGLKADDVVLAQPHQLAIYAELPKRPDVMYVAGGAAQNTMRGIQQLLPPNSTHYIGCVGQDAFAEMLREAAAKDGLRVTYQVDQETPTGSCAALITHHHRTLVTNLQAANKYSVEHLRQPEVWAWVDKARCIYIEGFFYTVSPAAIMALAEHCAATNKIFIMNLSAPFISQFYRDPLDASAPYWDVLIGNEAEAEAYAKSHQLDLYGNHDIALYLANALPKINTQRKRIVILTHGPNETTVCVQGMSEPWVIPVPKVPDADVVDSNGCGDAFVAGFIAHLVQGAEIQQCVHVGHWLAAQVIRQSGAQYPKPLSLPPHLSL